MPTMAKLCERPGTAPNGSHDSAGLSLGVGVEQQVDVDIVAQSVSNDLSPPTIPGNVLGDTMMSTSFGGNAPMKGGEVLKMDGVGQGEAGRGAAGFAFDGVVAAGSMLARGEGSVATQAGATLAIDSTHGDRTGKVMMGKVDVKSKAASRAGARKRRAAVAAAAAEALARDSAVGKTPPSGGAGGDAADQTAITQTSLIQGPQDRGTAKVDGSSYASQNGGTKKPTGRSRRRRRGSAASRQAARNAAAGDKTAAKDEIGNPPRGDDPYEGDMGEEEEGRVLGGGDMADGRAEDVCEEDDEGNVEYKLKLVDPPLDRLEHLFTQMNWRLNEGRGECMYMLGYEDDGKATGVSPSDLSASIKTLRVMMEAVGAKIASMQVQAGAGGGKLKVARVTVVRQAAVLDGLSLGSERRGLRVGVLGHAGAGKSTLVGVLTRGLSDNGRGLARMQVFRHNHEVFNGQTSSISQQALTLPLAHREAIPSISHSTAGSRNLPGGSGGGSAKLELRTKMAGASSDAAASRLSSSFPRSSRLGSASASNGFASAWARGRRRGDSLDEGGRRRPQLGGAASDDEGKSRVLTFIDQPGHEKYLKTTLTGMTGSALDYAMLVVSGVAGVQRMTREHLAIALALQLPLFVVMTKSDVAGSLPPGPLSARPPSPQQTSATALPTAAELALQGLDRVLWACMGRRASIVGGVEDAEGAAEAVRGGSGPSAVSWDGLVPVIQVSSVSADGLANLRAFLGRLAPPEPLEAMYKEARGKAAEVRISETFMVEGVGEVYAGTVISGTVSVGDRLLLGPTGPNGAFLRTTVASVHVSRLAVRRASAGQTASFTLVADPEGDHADGDDSDTDPLPGVTPTPVGCGGGGGASGAGGGVGSSIGLAGGIFADGDGEMGMIAAKDGGINGGVVGTSVVRAVSGITFVTPDETQNGAVNALSGRGSDNSSDRDSCWTGGPQASGDGSATFGIHGKISREVSGRGSGGSKRGVAGVRVESEGKTAGASPLLFDGEGAAGEGESPGKRTRKGMVLVEATSRPNTTYEFEAEVMILHHPRVIRENYQPVVHAHNICQSARITSMVRSVTTSASAPSEGASGGGAAGIKSGERAVCRFRFLYRPEYLSAGTTIVLREGRTRGFGKVISVH